MKKDNVIKVISKKLMPYDFKYVKYENYRWLFSREIKGINQNIVIQKSIWDNNMYILEINTSVSKRYLRVRDFVNDPQYVNDFFTFKDEQEHINVLNEIADVVIKYGIEELNRRSFPIKSYHPTEDMYKELFENNIALANNFFEKNNLSILMTNEVLQTMKEKLCESFEKEYEEVQSVLVELSAVYGNMLIEKMGGQWKYNQYNQNTTIDCGPLYVGYPVLNLFVKYWQEKTGDLLIREYMEIILSYEDWIMQCKKVYGNEWNP